MLDTLPDAASPPQTAAANITTLGSAIEQGLAQAQSITARWRGRVMAPVHGVTDADHSWLALVPDAGPACEVILADALLHDLRDDEREGLLNWIRGTQDEAGGWLDASGRPNLSLTVLGWWARAAAGDDPRTESMIRAARVVHALGGAQRANFSVRLWLAVAGQIPWDFLPAIPGELFLLPPPTWLSPSRFSPWARGVLTPYYAIARSTARLQLPDASELLLQRGGEGLIAPRLTRPGLAGDLLQAFDRTVKLSRRLPRGPLRKWALERASNWLDGTQQEHGGWFSTRPTLLSIVALRVLGAPSDDPRITRGLAHLRRCRGLARIRSGNAQGEVALAQGLSTTALDVAGRLVLADPNEADRAALMRLELAEFGPWQHRADAPAGGWPTEPGAAHHLDLEATCGVLEALTTVPSSSSQTAPAWATTRRATDVILAMQEPTGAFARFERGESMVWMSKLPWTDADLLSFGHASDPSHVRVSAMALARLGHTGFHLDDDRVGRGVRWLTDASRDEHTDRSIDTLAALTEGITATCPSDHPMRGELERRLRGRQRENGSFGSLVETARALSALVRLDGACVQVQRGARYLLEQVQRLGPDLEHEGATTRSGSGLSPDVGDPSAAAREITLALRAVAEAK